LWLLPSPWRGDLQSLSPVSGAALKLDAALRADIGAPEAGVLVALAARDEAGALALAEAAGERLDRLVSQGVLRGYDSPARLLPSPAMQQARRDALPDAATLQQRLAQATTNGPLKSQRLGAFIDDVQAARAQAVVTRATLDGTPLANAIDGLLMPARDGKPWRALLTLHGLPEGVDVRQVRAGLADLPAARVVDIKPELDALYARYLHEAMWQASLGALAVCVLLAARLRSMRALVRVIVPIGAAVVVVVAALSASGVALGILHLVGVLLVVAIGSNYALFFEHLRTQRSADDDTLASLALANLTTVISFGLLAASSIAPLAAIGLVVAPGALLCLVMAAAFIAPPTGKHPVAMGK
jgi:predicted exporter